MLCSDEAHADPAQAAAVMGACAAWSEEMVARGVLKDSRGLRAASDATTVKRRRSEVLITDGPFAETKDQIGGYALIECADLDEALEVAGRHPWAEFGQIEVRPVWEP